VVKAADLAGAAHLMLVDGVSYLDPEPAVFEAMLEGWTKQQRARFLKWDGTIKPRLSLVRRFAEFSNQYPWQWQRQSAEFEAFIDHLRTKTPTFTVSSGRNYQNHLRLFCEYITDPRYGWMSVCQEKFGEVPAQILHEWNTVTHVSEYEGDPRRRPLTHDEIQDLFDAADGRVEKIRKRGRKGALTAMRDSALIKTYYAYGMRRRENVGLDLADLRRNPKAPQYRRHGAVFVRWGKSSKGRHGLLRHRQNPRRAEHLPRGRTHLPRYTLGTEGSVPRTRQPLQDTPAVRKPLSTDGSVVARLDCTIGKPPRRLQ
jgi:integrase